MEPCWEVIRQDFPILKQTINGRPLVYMDNAATTQLPERVLREVERQYHCYQSNVHRGIHTLSEQSTSRMEHARVQAQRFFGAAEPAEIIFTGGATASINLLARSLSFGGLKPGDEIITTQMEHHANLIPWQEACRRSGATLRVVPVLENGELDQTAYAQFLSEKTRLVAVTWVSNVTGAVNPVKAMAEKAHSVGAQILVDGAQAVRHFSMDLNALDWDFFCCSGHKMMGMTGTGILYGKRSALETLAPETFGGGMVDQVTDTCATYGDLPFRLEAGTPNIVGNIALGEALQYLQSVGIDDIAARETALLDRIVEWLEGHRKIRLLGAPQNRAGCVSFCVEGMHSFDVAKLLDQLGVAVRSGHHCAEPYLAALGETGAVRISPAFYNTEQDVDQLFCALDRVCSVLERRTRYGIHR